jgi:hypothetical protein
LSPALTGAWIGAALGLLSFAVLRWAATRMEGHDADEHKKRSASLIRMTALADLMLFPVIGYVAGPMVLNG